VTDGSPLVVGAPRSIAETAEDLERLARVAANPFALPVWLGTAAEILEAGNEVTVWPLTTAGRLVALVALVRRPDRTVAFLGDPLSDLTGPVAAPADRAASARALRHLLDRELRPGERLASRGVPGSVARELPSTAISRWEPSPVVDCDRSWDAYLAAADGRRRRRIAREAERLLEAGAIVHDAATVEDVERAMRDLRRLHEARFGAASRTFAGARGTFLDCAVAALAADRVAQIRLLEIEGRIVASLLVFRFAGDDWFYQSGWDPSLAALSIGRCLFADTVRRAFEEGRGAFRLLRGDEEYKSYWATRDEPVAAIELSTRSR
jgi:CelD/BcsL family acetyltransferase involved in cellulose biosynthesis